MTLDEAKKKIDSDPNFIYNKRFDNSLEKCIDRYPDGAPDKVIAQSLLMSEEEVADTYLAVIEKLKNTMKVE